MQDKKQIIGLILSVVLSVGLVVVGVNAATTVGNDVTVGNALTVTGTTTVGTILSVGATTTLSATTTISGTLILSNAADLFVGTGTSTFAGAVTIANNVVASDDLAVTGTTTLSSGLSVANNIVASDDLSVAGYTTTTGGLSIGGGLVISKLYSTSTVLDFGAIAAAACATSNTSISGVLPGDVVSLGMAQTIAGATTTVTWNGWVPAADLVYVRVCNIGTSGPTPNFDSGTVRIDVWQH